MVEGKMEQLRVWWQAFRYHFIPPSIFAAALGGMQNSVNGFLDGREGKGKSNTQ